MVHLQPPAGKEGVWPRLVGRATRKGGFEPSLLEEGLLLEFGGAHSWEMRSHNAERGLHEEAHPGPASCSSKCLDSHFLFA